MTSHVRAPVPVMSILGNSPKFSSISWSNAENVSDTSVWGCSSDSTVSQNFAYSFYNLLSELFGFVAETKLFWKFVAMAAFWKLRLANFNSLIERLSNAR
jgi:hypothetical protein